MSSISTVDRTNEVVISLQLRQTLINRESIQMECSTKQHKYNFNTLNFSLSHASIGGSPAVSSFASVDASWSGVASASSVDSEGTSNAGVASAALSLAAGAVAVSSVVVGAVGTGGEANRVSVTGARRSSPTDATDSVRVGASEPRLASPIRHRRTSESVMIPRRRPFLPPCRSSSCEAMSI
jgi:hypothetical protein